MTPERLRDGMPALLSDGFSRLFYDAGTSRLWSLSSGHVRRQWDSAPQRTVVEILMRRWLAESAEASCVFVTREDGHVLATTRRGTTNRWGLPGGRVDPGETPVMAAIRETREETGFEIVVDEVPLYVGPCDDGPLTVTYRARIVGTCARRPEDEDIRVGWVLPKKLQSGPFGAYNAKVLERAQAGA